MAEKTIFVTVGTTKFDNLIRRVTDNSVQKVLKENGFYKILMQIGNGSFEPLGNEIEGIKIEHYRLKESITEDILSADLVVSHAGAGTCLETLELGKRLIVVVNENLMDNHQTELASALHSRNYAVSCTPDSLLEVLQGLESTVFVHYPKPDAAILSEYLNNLMDIKQD